MPVGLELLGQFRCNLCQRLVRSQSHADGQSHLALYPLLQVFAPLLEPVGLGAVEIDKALVDGIAEIGGSFLADNADHAPR